MDKTKRNHRRHHQKPDLENETFEWQAINQWSCLPEKRGATQGGNCIDTAKLSIAEAKVIANMAANNRDHICLTRPRPESQ